MTNIKTLDERIEAHPGVSVPIDVQLRMSMQEVKELRAALAESEHRAWCAEVNEDGAREHLAEVRKQAIPDGWQLVPKEPTDDMIVAFAEQWYSKCQCIDDPDMLDAYKAMLEVAPQPEDAK